MEASLLAGRGLESSGTIGYRTPAQAQRGNVAVEPWAACVIRQRTDSPSGGAEGSQARDPVTRNVQHSKVQSNKPERLAG